MICLVFKVITSSAKVIFLEYFLFACLCETVKEPSMLGSLIFLFCSHFTSFMPSQICFQYLFPVDSLSTNLDEDTESLQSCRTLCNSMDCDPPHCYVHRILQARILEWIAMPYSRGS